MGALRDEPDARRGGRLTFDCRGARSDPGTAARCQTVDHIPFWAVSVAGLTAEVPGGLCPQRGQEWTVAPPPDLQTRGRRAGSGGLDRGRSGRPSRAIQLQAESGILTGSAGTNVATETCGHDRFLKLRFTVWVYWI
jgi:hypothetical protein